MDEQGGTVETVKAELSIFDSLPYQVTHIKGDWIRQKPENNCLGWNTGTPIIFKIPKAPGLYLDFNDTFLDMEVSIELVNEDKIGSIAVAFVNYAMHTLFKDISFFVNQTKIKGEN